MRNVSAEEGGTGGGTCNRDARVSILVHEGRGVDSGGMRAADIRDVLMAPVAVLVFVNEGEMQWSGSKRHIFLFFCLLSFFQPVSSQKGHCPSFTCMPKADHPCLSIMVL